MSFMVIRFLSNLTKMKPQQGELYYLLYNKLIKLAGVCDISSPRTWDTINFLLNHPLMKEALLTNLCCVGLVKELQ